MSRDDFLILSFPLSLFFLDLSPYLSPGERINVILDLRRFINSFFFP